MEERKIVESVNTYQKSLRKICIVLFVMALISLILIGIMNYVNDIIYSKYYEAEIFSQERENYEAILNSLWIVFGVCPPILVFGTIIDVILWGFYFIIWI